MTLSDLYNTEGNDFTDALFDHWDAQASAQRDIMLANDLYEHSAE